MKTGKGNAVFSFDVISGKESTLQSPPPSKKIDNNKKKFKICTVYGDGTIAKSTFNKWLRSGNWIWKIENVLVVLPQHDKIEMLNKKIIIQGT